jgi:hypothetical protein
MATNISQDDFHKTGLRLPKDLHMRLHEAAAESGRSYNAEIVARLQQSFNLEPLKEAKRDELEKLVNELIDHKMAKFSAKVGAAAPSGAVKPTEKSIPELLNDLEVDSKKSYVMRKAREEQMASEKSASSKKR